MSVATTKPSARNSTFAIPASSVAAAASCTVVPTTAPSAGAVSAAVGGVTSTPPLDHDSVNWPVAVFTSYA